MNAHWPVWGLLSLPIYSPQSSRIVLTFCSAIILSGNMNSWLWRLYFHFLESFGISKFMYTHRLMLKSGFVTALQLTIFVIKALHKQFVWVFLVTGLVVLNVNVTWAVFVAAIIGMIGSRLGFWYVYWGTIYVKTNLSRFLTPNNIYMYLKANIIKKMTIKIRDIEIPILVFGPFPWPNHFIVLNCVVLA